MFDTLASLLAPLDYPRQSAANLGRGLYRAGSGTAGLGDYLGMAPGALGLGIGAAFGLPAGALAAGAAQGLGRMTGLSAFDAPEPSALVEALGGNPDSFVENLGARVATDPLTYVGLQQAAKGVGKLLPGKEVPPSVSYSENMRRVLGDMEAKPVAAEAAPVAPSGGLPGLFIGHNPEVPGELQLVKDGSVMGVGNIGRAGGETRTANRMFPGVLGPDEGASRIHDFGIDKTLHGQGLGEQMVLSALDHASPEWLYNSQASDKLRPLYDRLAQKGWAELHWQQLPGGRGQGELHLMRITPEGKEALKNGWALKGPARADWEANRAWWAKQEGIPQLPAEGVQDAGWDPGPFKTTGRPTELRALDIPDTEAQRLSLALSSLTKEERARLTALVREHYAARMP